MNNMECVVQVLAAHRKARQWSDEAVAADLLAQLGMDPAGEAKNAVTPVDPGVTEAEVIAHEKAAEEAVEKAKAARAELNAKADAEAKAKVDAVADQEKAAKDARDAAAKEAEANADAMKPEPMKAAEPVWPATAPQPPPGPMTALS